MIFPQKVLDITKIKTQGDLKFPMLGSIKIDGVYCVYVGGNIYSLTGKVYTSLEHLKLPLLELLILTGNDVIIFEAMKNPVRTPQSEISGAVRSTKKQAPDICAYVHDGLTLSEFIDGGGRGYKERIEKILRLDDKVPGWYKNQITIAHNITILNMDEATEFANCVIAYGLEGIVLREMDACYQPGKRNASMVKIKRGVSYDLKVLCVKEGKGKYKGMVGYLVCQWKDGKTINVGSGLTDEQRKRWWSGFFYDEIVNKIVQVDAMAESTKGVLRQPIFKGIRFDKQEADY